MSTNSIRTYDQESLQTKYADKLDHLAHLYSYKRNFMIGVGVNNEEVEHTLLMNRILCSDQCELINYVADIIAGELEDCGIKPADKKLTTLTTCCKESQNACEFDKCNPRIEF